MEGMSQRLKISLKNSFHHPMMSFHCQQCRWSTASPVWGAGWSLRPTGSPPWLTRILFLSSVTANSAARLACGYPSAASGVLSQPSSTGLLLQLAIIPTSGVHHLFQGSLPGLAPETSWPSLRRVLSMEMENMSHLSPASLGVCSKPPGGRLELETSLTTYL